MTTKTAEKTPPQPSATTAAQQEVQAAYHCHTLAQILYGQIAATHPWLLQVPGVPARPVAMPFPCS